MGGIQLNKKEEGVLTAGPVLEVSKAVLVRSSEEKNVLTSMQLGIYMQLEFILLLGILMPCLNNPFPIFLTVGITSGLFSVSCLKRKGVSCSIHITISPHYFRFLHKVDLVRN